MRRRDGADGAAQAAIASEAWGTGAEMRREAADGRAPGIGDAIFGGSAAMERREKESGCLFLVRLFLEILGNAERRADEAGAVAPRIGRRRDIFLDLIAGDRRIESRRKGREQREDRKEDLCETAMEARLTQNEPPSMRRLSIRRQSRTVPAKSRRTAAGARAMSGKSLSRT
jgi:hypothetical protein